MVLNDAGTPISNNVAFALSRGLSFLPISKIDKKEFTAALARFRRLVDLRIFWNEVNFRKKEKIHSSHISRFLKSDWAPPRPFIKDTNPDWVELVNSTTKIINDDRRRPNLPAGVWKEWKSFNQNKEFYVLPADKGGRTVIWKSSDYIAEAHRQLSDSTTYLELTQAEAEASIATQVIARDAMAKRLFHNGNISKAEHERIKTAEIAIPAFYLLPKIHKAKNITTGTFYGRPIVSCTNSVWKNLDRFLADTTSPLLHRIPGCVIDSTHLLNNISSGPPLDQNCTLASADVVALYPSMPWEETLEASTKFYTSNFNFLCNHNRSNNLLPPPPPGIFKDLLRLILENNIFHFQDARFFRQLKGTTMGCSMSVFMANTFMFYRSQELIHQPPPDLIHLHRFIDDWLIVFRGPPTAIPALFASVIDESIKLTFEFGGKRINMLDLTLTLEDDNSISSRVFRKPTDGHQFVHWTSNHKASLIPSLVGAQSIRYRRNCSKDEDFEAEIALLSERFIRRGFPTNVIQQQIAKVREAGRAPLLSRKTKLPLERMVFVSKNLGSLDRPIGRALRKFYNSFRASTLLQPHTEKYGPPLPKDPPILAECNTTSFGSLLGPKYKRGSIKQRPKKGPPLLTGRAAPRTAPPPPPIPVSVVSRNCKSVAGQTLMTAHFQQIQRLILF